MSYDSSEEASSLNMRQATTTSEESEGTHDDVTTPRSASSNPNPGNIDSGIEYGGSSNMASTDEDPNASDDENRRSRGHRLERMTVGGVRGQLTSVIDVDMTPPDKLLQMASEKAQKLTRRNKNKEAVLEYVKILALSRIVFGDSHWRVAEAHVSLARSYLELRGLAEQAKQHCESARNVIFQISKIDPSQRENLLSVKLSMLVVLGRSLTKLKKYEEAESALSRADVCSRERNRVSIVDPSAMMKTDNTIATALAKLYICQKKFPSVITCFEQVTELTSKIYGEESDHLMQAYIDLGKAEQAGAIEGCSSCSHDKGIEHLLHAHSLAATNHPGSSRETAKTSEVLGNAYMSMADSNKETAEDCLKSAESYLIEASDIYTQLNGSDHSDSIRAAEQLALLYVRLKDFESAKKFANSVFSSKVEVFGDTSEETANTAQTIGTICLSQGSFDEAHKKLKKAYAIFTQIYGRNCKKAKDVEKMIDIIEQSPQMKEKMTKEKALQNRPAFKNNFKSSQT